MIEKLKSEFKAISWAMTTKDGDTIVYEEGRAIILHKMDIIGTYHIKYGRDGDTLCMCPDYERPIKD